MILMWVTTRYISATINNVSEGITQTSGELSFNYKRGKSFQRKK